MMNSRETNKRRVLVLAMFFFTSALLGGCQPRRSVGEEPAAPTRPAAWFGREATDEGSWPRALQEVYKGPLELWAQHEAELSRGIHYRKLMRGDPRRRWVALTFDDGPHPLYTPRLLKILARYHARATFFVVGKMAEQSPELVRAEVAAGHSVGNHTYHHVNLTRISPGLVATEIVACGDIISGFTHRPCRLFRPPGGDYNQVVAETANVLGYTLILWTDDPGDYASPGDNTIVDRTLARVSNGGIILIHDGVQETVDVLPELLEVLRARGFELVTIEQMLADTPAR